jgi:uncharacterized membrane protein YdcZ (DUF606 family)
MLLTGFFLSIQGPTNARLRLALESRVFAAAVSCLTGSLVLLGIMATDTFGWFGVNKIPVDPLRLLGIALLIVGVLLVQRK